MVTNPSIKYKIAERKYLTAKTDEEKLEALEEMLKFMPKHKGAEKLIANLKARYAKIKAKIEEKKLKEKNKKHKIISIEKQGVQICIYGFTKSGKSLFLTLFTNAKPKISDIPYTTLQPEKGMFNYKDVNFQLIEFPSLYGNEENDKKWLSYALTTDLILILAKSLNEAEEIFNEFISFNEKIIDKNFLIIINEINRNFNLEKITFEDKTKKFRKTINVIFCDIKKFIPEIKEQIFSSFKIYRIYLKKPEEKNKEEKPIVFLKQPTIEDVLKKIKISKEKLLKAVVSGKSVKFDRQIVKIDHKLEDNDIVEFHFKKI